MKITQGVLHCLFFFMTLLREGALWKGTPKCPSLLDASHCTCSSSEGLSFQCQGSSTQEISNILSATKTTDAIRSLSIFHLNTSLLGGDILGNTLISEIIIKRSGIKELHENIFMSTGNRLHTLVISECQLEAVPRAITKVSSLMRLELDNNRISTVYPFTFFGPSKLSYLSLKSNRLDSLVENGLMGLENTIRELILADNHFSIFPMSAIKILKKLTLLNLSQNKLSNVSFEGYNNRLDSLLNLEMSFNEFEILHMQTFSSMPNLKHLDVSHNQLHFIQEDTFFSQSNLAILDLSYNSLAELPPDIFHRCHRLTFVDLSHNRLKGLSQVFKDLIALEEVALNNNMLLSLGQDWFNNSPNLKTIRLQHNIIFEIQSESLQPLKRLSELHLSFNFLSVITRMDFRYNVALNTLNLDNNHISVIETGSFRGVPRLRELRLQNNVLKEVSRELFSSLAQLSELHLQDNKITKIEPQAFSGLALLQYLDLRGNKLTKVEDVMMRYPSTLRSMYLDGNRISSFHKETFSGQTTVEVLSISNNRLEIITPKMFEELINLFRLTLSNNRIVSIEDYALQGLHQVRVMDLSNNRIVKLTNATLKGLQQAETLSLNNNRINSISNEAFSGFHHLKELDLSHNRIRMIRNGAFRGCLTLHTLRLNDAGIRFIAPNALDDFKKLSVLEMSQNQLLIPEAIHRLTPNPGPSPLSSLKVLVLSHNDLSNATRSKDYTLSGLSNLETIELEGCNLSKFRKEFLWENTKLKTIRLGSNKLEELEEEIFSKQVFLEELHLDRNKFKSVPREATRYLFNLRLLNLSGNMLRENVDESSFDNVAGLKLLDLSGNSIKHIPERTFHNISGLLQLNISNNSFLGFQSRTFVPLVQLSSLISNHNTLPFIPIAIQGLRSVRTLCVGGNPLERLKEIPESRAVMHSVTTAQISGTNLSILETGDLGLFPNLINLDLSRNQLTMIAPYSFSKLTQLLRLDLSYNQILQLTSERFAGLESLSTLNLSYNLLSSLFTFPKENKNLKILDVSFNRLQSLSIDSRSFIYLSSLLRLDLRGNRLSSIDSPLSPLTSLRALDLSDNLFTDIPLSDLNSVQNSLERLDFDGNPFICSCNSYTQKIWLRQHRKWLHVDRRGSKVGPSCFEPIHLKDRYLLTIKDSELCPLPSVESLGTSELLPHSFTLTWESADTNMTGLKGFIVAYHRLDQNDQVKKYRVGPSTRGFRVNALADNTLYLICVITRGSSYTSSVLHKQKIHGENHHHDGEESGSKDGEEGRQDHDEEDENENVYVPNEDEIIRFKRSGNSVFSKDVFGTVFPYFFNNVDSSEDLRENHNLSDKVLLSYPSSNDSDLLVLKPTVLNLGSESSKCKEVRTSMDPAKLSLFDNKRLSIFIGVVAGLFVFIGIIILIVIKPKKKDEDDIIIPDSTSSSYKSPGSAKRSVEGPPLRGKTHSRTNSMSSSAVPSGAISRQKDSSGGGGGGGTLSRRRTPQGHTSPRPHPPPKQGSTESVASRQSSFDTNHSSKPDHGLLSWQGTPKPSHNGRPRPPMPTSDGYPTFPRRNADRSMQTGLANATESTMGSGNSIEGLHPPLKRRSEPTSIPLIEYHLVEDEKDRNGVLHHHHHHHHLHHFPPKGVRPPWRFKSIPSRFPSPGEDQTSHRHGHPQTGEDYFPEMNPNKPPAPRGPPGPPPSPGALNRAFIKYNSFANY
ncbi:uncharacterized protein [Lepeophtheirus salmonis]|uniref:uncharacterized protein n=1 Tax=Lepeophtheirus salmonis TaxID=72036 RepID=UPI001AE90371|nr:protein artichoke-like [Lepeophtheirus salmonis]